MDAAAQFEISNKFNVWVGRFLPPSDRANLYGPYYAHHWAVFTDGVQDGYPVRLPGARQRRDVLGPVRQGEGVGRRLRRPVAADGGAAITCSAPAASRSTSGIRKRGYYLNGTYYGDKNLLAVGLAGQVQGSDNTRRAASTSCSSRRWAAAAPSRSKRSGRRYRPARRLQRRRLRHRRRRLRAGQLLSSRRRRARPVRGARQVRPGELQRRPDAVDPTTTRRRRRSISTTSSSSSTRA